MDISEYLDNLDFVISALDTEIDKIIASEKEKILHLNREKQLFDLGIGSDGKKLFPDYANITIFDKRQRGLPFNRVTLFQTGKFYDGFDIINRSDKITIFSRDSKTSDLQDKYGSSIFGLTKENEYLFNYEILLPKIQEYLHKHL